MKEIIVEVGMQYTRTALVEDKELVEFYVEENKQQSVVGNIYKGLIQKVIPGLGAAFIDVGEEKNAYLSLAEQPPVFWDSGISPSTLKGGQGVTVQAIKEGTEVKGITVTTHISLPGKFFVLLSDRGDIHVSKKIKEESERQRLIQIAQKYKKENHGVIIRTEAKERTEEELRRDYLSLQKKWEDILKRQAYAMPKTLIHQEFSSGLKNAREFFTEEVDAYKINNQKLYEQVRDFVSKFSPPLVHKVQYTEKDLFREYGLELKVIKALKPKVWLKSGGTLFIEETEALTVIDVNSGKFIGKKNVEDTIVQTNLEAVEEIAKQVRLRNLSGIIIIDFIDMEKKIHQEHIFNALKKAFEKDRVPTYVLGMTSLGLVEMTRKKMRNSLQLQLLQPCSHCYGGKQYGKAFLIPKIEKEILSIINNTSAKEILLEGSEEIIHAFEPYKKKFLKPLQFQKNPYVSSLGYKVSPLFSFNEDKMIDK